MTLVTAWSYPCLLKKGRGEEPNARVPLELLNCGAGLCPEGQVRRYLCIMGLVWEPGMVLVQGLVMASGWAWGRHWPQQRQGAGGNDLGAVGGI